MVEKHVNAVIFGEEKLIVNRQGEVYMMEIIGKTIQDNDLF